MGDRQAASSTGPVWTVSWLRRNRRLMAHYEALAIIAQGFAKLAMISVMLHL